MEVAVDKDLVLSLIAQIRAGSAGDLSASAPKRPSTSRVRAVLDGWQQSEETGEALDATAAVDEGVKLCDVMGDDAVAELLLARARELLPPAVSPWLVESYRAGYTRGERRAMARGVTSHI
mgnify:CR=1 FL=1